MEETTRRGFMGGMAAVGAAAAIGAVGAESKQGDGPSTASRGRT